MARHGAEVVRSCPLRPAQELTGLFRRLTARDSIERFHLFPGEVGDGGIVAEIECGAGAGDAGTKLVAVSLRVFIDCATDKLGLPAVEQRGGDADLLLGLCADLDGRHGHADLHSRWLQVLRYFHRHDTEEPECVKPTISHDLTLRCHHM